jgi:hypothetical protein
MNVTVSKQTRQLPIGGLCVLLPCERGRSTYCRHISAELQKGRKMKQGDRENQVKRRLMTLIHSRSMGCATTEETSHFRGRNDDVSLDRLA